MKLKIDKELEKSSEERKRSLDIDSVSQVKLLLDKDSQEDVMILRNLSDKSEFNRIEHTKDLKLQLESLEDEYQGSVFTIEQIKDLCVKYNLRFLSSKLYTGSYDVEVAAKIKDFARTTNSHINEYTLKTKFFIMAPKEMFELTEEVYISKAELRRQLDPVIFYKIDDNHYRLIHKWGSDFSIFRALSGFRWSNFLNYNLFNTFMVLPFVTFLVPQIFEKPLTGFSNYPIITAVVMFLLSFGIAFLFFGVSKSDDGEPIKGFFSDDSWNSENKIVRK